MYVCMYVSVCMYVYIYAFDTLNSTPIYNLLLYIYI